MKQPILHAHFDLSRFSDSPVSKVAFTIFLAILAFGLTVAGLIFGIKPFAQHVSTWQLARNFIPVEAKVVQSELVAIPAYTRRRNGGYSEDSRISNTYQAKATFAYQFQGKKYLSYRINLLPIDHEGRDNYPKDIFNQLDTSQKNGETVTLWVNPQQPDYAVYDRSIIWPAFILLIPFTLAFPIASLGIVLFLVSFWRSKPKPELHNVLQLERFLPSKPPGIASSIFNFLVFNLIIWPIAPNAWLYQTEYGFPFVKALLIVFGGFMFFLPLFNLFMAWKSRQRLGDLALQLTLPDNDFSKSLHGKILFAPPLGSRLSSAPESVAVTINLEYYGRYKDRRDRQLNFSSIWHSPDQIIHAPLNASSQKFELAIPEKITLSPDDKLTYYEYFWIIRIEIFGNIAQFKLGAHPHIPVIIPTTLNAH